MINEYQDNRAAGEKGLVGLVLVQRYICSLDLSIVLSPPTNARAQRFSHLAAVSSLQCFLRRPLRRVPPRPPTPTVGDPHPPKIVASRSEQNTRECEQQEQCHVSKIMSVANTKATTVIIHIGSKELSEESHGNKAN